MSSETDLRVRAAGWILAAACRDEDPELFFPIGTTGPSLLQVEAAKQVCGRCPVRADCLQWALQTGQDAGIWGGLTETERRQLKSGRSADRPHSPSAAGGGFGPAAERGGADAAEVGQWGRSAR